ncbi:hypothetical protein QUA20_27740 [Microcoleus sp. Pol7_A1]
MNQTLSEIGAALHTDRDPLLNDVEQALLWQVQKQPPLYWWPEPKTSST